MSSHFKLPNIHVLIVTCSSILVIGGDVQLRSLADWDICITDSVASTDLRTFLQSQLVLAGSIRRNRRATYGIQGHSQWTARIDAFSFLGVVNDRLVVLGESIRNVPVK